jgi:hypothetical protein
VFHPQTGLEAYAERLAEALPRAATIECLSALGSLHYDSLESRSPSEQRRRLAMVGPRSAAPWFSGVEVLIDQGGVLIHQHGIAMLMRLALLHAEDRRNGSEFVDTLVKLMLVVNDLFGRHQGLVGPDTTDEELIDVELLGAIVPEGDTTSILARQFTFLRWIDEADRRSLDNWVDVRGDFARLLNISAEEYLVGAAFFVLYLVGATGRLAGRNPPIIRISALEQAFAYPERLCCWIELFAAPLAAVRQELVATERDYSAASLVPFLRHPLINVDGEIVVCPLPATLDNLLGAGFYFALFDAYKKNGEEAAAQQFSSMYGRFFEHYIGTLLDRIVDPATTSVFREQTYLSEGGEARTSDFFVLDSARRLVVVEVVKTRLNLLTTLVGRDRNSLAADIKRIILTNVRQITRTLRDLRAERFSLPCSYDDLDGIYALIVAGQRLPGLYGVNAIAARALHESRLSEARAVHQMDIDELEILAAQHDHSLPLGQILESKAEHVDRYARNCRLQSFIDQYTDVRPAGDRIVSADFDAFFSTVVMPTLNAWGLRE